MNEIDELLKDFPPGVREHLRKGWDRMPEAARGHLTEALRELPGDLGRWRELMRLALSNVRIVDGNDRQMDNRKPGPPDRRQIITGVVDTPLDGQLLRLDVINVTVR